MPMSLPASRASMSQRRLGKRWESCGWGCTFSSVKRRMLTTSVRCCRWLLRRTAGGYRSAPMIASQPICSIKARSIIWCVWPSPRVLTRSRRYGWRPSTRPNTSAWKIGGRSFPVAGQIWWFSAICAARRPRWSTAAGSLLPRMASRCFPSQSASWCGYATR